MKVSIKIFYHDEYPILKEIIKELENKQAIVNKVSKAFELSVKSFDEIIYLLDRYNAKINIELSIYSVDKIGVWIYGKKGICSLADQVE